MKQFTTSEITEGLDLLGDFLDAKGYTEEAGLCTIAMDEINRLRDALRPFADMAQYYENYTGVAKIAMPIDVDAVRAARAAYLGEKDD